MCVSLEVMQKNNQILINQQCNSANVNNEANKELKILSTLEKEIKILAAQEIMFFKLGMIDEQSH